MISLRNVGLKSSITMCFRISHKIYNLNENCNKILMENNELRGSLDDQETRCLNR